MAVKQNNADTNDSVGGNAGTATSGSGKTAVGGGVTKGSGGTTVNGGPQLKIKMNPNADGASNGNGSAMGNGVDGGGDGTGDQVGLSSGVDGDQSFSNSLDNAEAVTIPTKPNDIGHVLALIELVEQRTDVLCPKDVIKVYRHLIYELSQVHIPRQTPEDLKRFKEDIAKVGEFFAKCEEKRLYLFFLRIVCSLITTGEETPSCAIAVIFQLFDSDLVVEAVRSLLEHNIPDLNIRKTVRLLSEWLRICNFCQNLNLWIMAILTGLSEQQKYDLITQIALENIDQLFSSLIVPVLRPKVAYIVFHMLSSITHTPLVFHKILPKFPRVITYLKQQANSLEEYALDTKKLLQQLVDLTSALMVRFYGYEELYEPIEAALKDFEPSDDYLSFVCHRSNNEESTSDLDTIGFSNNAKVGLVNLGNTCYMNSVLQALAMTKEFSREILLSESKSPILIKMQQQIALMLYSLRYELTPIRILNAIRPPGFSPGLQQDSSEFLGYLLEMLHEQEVAYLKKANNAVQPNSSLSNDTMAPCEDVEMTDAAAALDKNTTDLLPTNNVENGSSDGATIPPPAPGNDTATNEIQLMSTIDKTFTGKLTTTYRCLTCGWESRHVDSFRDLQLSFPEVKGECASNYSVQDLIDYYCSPEKLYGDNQYFCERCKRLTDAERYISVTSAPKNLILTLKHFKYDQKYHMRAKLMHKVFHDEKVSVKVCSNDSLEEVATFHYDLYAGVVHSGFSMDSGHYYTYASDSSNTWYKFNDNIVTTCTTEELHNLTPPNTPYILFYQMGARSNGSSEAGAMSNVIQVDVPQPLTLEELPRPLSDYVNHDNCAYAEEIKLQRLKIATAAALRNQTKWNNGKESGEGASNLNGRNGTRHWDDDDDDNPPPAGCGGNALNINVNRFVY